ncbi:MAG: hypothetical protein IBX63_11560 [Coriobacteriia bacterium]|nr:hypothetical protein [Coriobacteriia bacterium]
MTTRELHGTLVDVLLELAWRQWTALGVAGTRGTSSTVIDPEALLVATMSIGRWDARLFDEVLDWVVSNSSIVDPARLRRLARSAGSEQRRLMTAVVRIASQGAGRTGLEKVETELVAREEGASYALQPLFRSARAAVEDWVGPDEVFRSVGFARPTPELRGMSRAPDASNPACLRFKGRSLVGVGARAEVLVYLWTHEWAHGRLIAERAAYNQSPVAEYLVTLADARLAEKRAAGRRIEYRLEPNLRAVGEPTPRYVAWDSVWPALTRVVESLDSETLSVEALWSRLATALDTERAGLGAEGFDIHVPDLTGWAAYGPTRLEVIVELIIDRAQETVR